MKEILIEKTGYYYDKKYFDEHELERIRKNFKRKLNICILGENIFVYIVDKSFNDIERCLINFEKDNLIDDDTLVHYEYDRKLKILYIYSIKQGLRVYKLAKDVNRINVYPIQFKIKDLICKKIKEKNFFAVIMVKNYFYTIEVINKKIISSNCVEEQNFYLNDYANIIQSYDKIIIDKILRSNIKGKLDTINEEIIFVSLEEFID